MRGNAEARGVTIRMRPLAVVKDGFPAVVGALLAVVGISIASAGWNWGAIAGTLIATVAIGSFSSIRLTASTITMRRAWRTSTRRWADLSLHPKARDVHFILFDLVEDDPGRAWRLCRPSDFERDWRHGRIGQHLRQHRPDLLTEIDQPRRNDVA